MKPGIQDWFSNVPGALTGVGHNTSITPSLLPSSIYEILAATRISNTFPPREIGPANSGGPTLEKDVIGATQTVNNDVSNPENSLSNSRFTGGGDDISVTPEREKA